ncbi:hypothetical protein EOE18_13880 [Novosphingobium umbonatum]|uniref:LamG domain-containing protein n=1 Tax=Novosphingobium umbonatum TaxID=1908524 RepID=A0A3S2Y5G0_9SPHN|nr:LamG-like jellyroll fold domain-containing protein [Novosphingobium umbonatum]RVU03940.1 hypothetical protein EOE18_13880 [Novosphingobium umbonatum]
MGRRLSGNGSSGGKPKVEAYTVATTGGVVKTLARLLGGASVFAVFSADAGVTMDTGTGGITVALAAGESKSLVVTERAANGAGYFRPITLTGAAAVVTPPAGNVVTAMLMGQSEMSILWPDYGFIPQPAATGGGNLVVYYSDNETNGVSGQPVSKITVNDASRTGGVLSPAIHALGAFLKLAAPAKTFVLGKGSKQGTARYELYSDSTDGLDIDGNGSIDDNRSWVDFANVASAIETDYGNVDHLIECWYNADASYTANFKSTFWPFYFGVDASNNPVALGSATNANGYKGTLDHMLWDATAASADVKGRGIFARSKTKWHLLTPMPFQSAPNDTEATGFTAYNASSRNAEPTRANLHALANEARAQEVSLVVGPSAHIAKWTNDAGEYAYKSIHPSKRDPDGQVQLMWPIAIAMARAGGVTIAEPTVDSLVIGANNAYVDVLVNLPNGGTLTTLAALRAGTRTYTTSAPHQQPVTGFQLTRGGVARPVFPSSQTSYPQAFRGSVQIVDAGSGSPKKATVRITPETAFAAGEKLTYLAGEATAALLQTRDNDLYPWMMIEHIPALYDATATYPFPGVAVRPQQVELAIPAVDSTPFVARSAAFDGGDWFTNSSISVPASSNGLMSLWFKNTDSAWTTGKYVCQYRVGTTAVLELLTTTTGRMNMRLNNGSATDTLAFYAAAGNTQFAVNTWYHIMAAWTATGLSIYVNGSLVGTLAYTSLDMGGATITRLGLGAATTGLTPLPCEIGHYYLNVSATLDLSVQANREKFILAGAPVNLGATGQLPTGTTPEWYYDGAGAAWANKGSATGGTLTGALTAGAAPHL